MNKIKITYYCLLLFSILLNSCVDDNNEVKSSGIFVTIKDKNNTRALPSELEYIQADFNIDIKNVDSDKFDYKGILKNLNSPHNLLSGNYVISAYNGEYKILDFDSP